MVSSFLGLQPHKEAGDSRLLSHPPPGALKQWSPGKQGSPSTEEGDQQGGHGQQRPSWLELPPASLCGGPSWLALVFLSWHMCECVFVVFFFFLCTCL